MKKHAKDTPSSLEARREGVVIHRISLAQSCWNARGLYILLLLPVIHLIIFSYTPIYGVLMAFKNFQFSRGILGSPWVGLAQFRRFFSNPNFVQILRNTMSLTIYGFIAGWPWPILFALFIFHSRWARTAKALQTVTYAPNFLSTVIVCAIIGQLLGMRTGGVNMFLSSLGLKEINFMGSPALFPHIYVWSGIWQGFGAGSIIYISALSAVDPGLHEAAIIDGANMWQRVWHIDLATIKPIIVIGLILGVGGLLGTSVEKVLMLQNEQNMSVSETISVYVWRVGLTGSRPDYSYATAIGLFQNIVGLTLTLTVNKISKVLTGEAYWF